VSQTLNHCEFTTHQQAKINCIRGGTWALSHAKQHLPLIACKQPARGRQTCTAYFCRPIVLAQANHIHQARQLHAHLALGVAAAAGCPAAAAPPASLAPPEHQAQSAAVCCCPGPSESGLSADPHRLVSAAAGCTLAGSMTTITDSTETVSHQSLTHDLCRITAPCTAVRQHTQCITPCHTSACMQAALTPRSPAVWPGCC
jgi:hypothetical protein